MIPKGFKFAGVASGLKKKKELDLALIVSELPCNSAGTFTKNLVTAAPVIISKKNLANKKHFAIIANSGCANASTGKKGMEDAKKTITLLADELKIKPEEIFVASTGVISEFLPMDKIAKGIPLAVKALRRQPSNFAKAIMTTDTKPKSASTSLTIDRKKIIIYGTTKGSGMIHPNMATMLAFITTDANIPKPLLQKILLEAVEISFNRITVDGDTSTNDSVFLMANGKAKNSPLKKGTTGYNRFLKALTEVCQSLAQLIVIDGEGASRIAKIKVEKAKTQNDALTVARSIAGSLLVKTALHGGDPNWGRIFSAAGNSGVKIVPEKCDLYIGKHRVTKNGMAISGMESKLQKEMQKKKVHFRFLLNDGKESASYLFCDLSKEYISINADYRS